jgi:hypothetical protein
VGEHREVRVCLLGPECEGTVDGPDGPDGQRDKVRTSWKSQLTDPKR